MRAWAESPQRGGVRHGQKGAERWPTDGARGTGGCCCTIQATMSPSVNDLLPPHERVFGKTRPEPPSHALAGARSSPGDLVAVCGARAGELVCEPGRPPCGCSQQDEDSSVTHAWGLSVDPQTLMSATARRRQQSCWRRLTACPASPSPSCSTRGASARPLLRPLPRWRLAAGAAADMPGAVRSSPFWDDDHVDPGLASLWEYFTKHALQEARKKALDNDDSGGAGGLSTIGGMVGGAGGGKNFNTAEVHLQKGQEHMDKKEFAQAMECFKAASNWCVRPHSLAL